MGGWGGLYNNEAIDGSRHTQLFQKGNCLATTLSVVILSPSGKLKLLEQNACGINDPFRF